MRHIIGNSDGFCLCHKVKVRQVNQDEKKNSCPGVWHGARTPGTAASAGFNFVLTTTGFSVLKKQINASHHMKEEDGKQANFKERHKNSKGMEMVRIAVECRSPPENCTVSNRVNEEKTSQHKAGYCHDVLFAQGRLESLDEPRHSCFSHKELKSENARELNEQ